MLNIPILKYFAYERDNSTWIIPAGFLAILVVLDWNVACSGGFSLIAGIAPVLQVHYLLYLASIVLLVFAGMVLLFSRKYLYFVVYGVLMLGLGKYTIIDQTRIEERGQRNARNALHVMFTHPGRENIWYVEPPLKDVLLQVVKEHSWEAAFVGSFPISHTYRYVVRSHGVPAFELEVLLLRNETRFIVKKVETARKNVSMLCGTAVGQRSETDTG